MRKPGRTTTALAVLTLTAGLGVAGIALGAKKKPAPKPPGHGPSAEPGPSVMLYATLARSRVKVGEPVAVTLTVMSLLSEEIVIAHPDYWGVTEIYVWDESGKAVEANRFKAGRKAVKTLMKVPGGGSAEHALARLETYTCCGAYNFTGLLTPGRYTLDITVTNPPVKTDPPKGWKADWVGTLRAPKQHFEVVE